VLVAIVAIAVGAGIYAASRRSPVTAENVNDVEAPIATDEVRTEDGVVKA
jgi:PiT family inorganic phosphate transporter